MVYILNNVHIDIAISAMWMTIIYGLQLRPIVKGEIDLYTNSFHFLGEKTCSVDTARLTLDRPLYSSYMQNSASLGILVEDSVHRRMQ